jgi:hypothetical protein
MRVRALAAIVGLVAALAGCGGFGLPKQQPGETYPGERREVTGTVEVDSNGCIRVRLDDGPSYWAIWPASANQGDGNSVDLGSFKADLRDGDRVRGTAALTPLATLPGGSHGYWALHGGYCTHDGETQAIVFDSAEGVDG